MLDEIIERVKDYKLISVRGTPACGKTTLMHLLANRLYTRYGASIPIYTLTGWQRRDVEAAGGWSGYLERITGVRGTLWLGHNAFLLFDEAQQSYWDFNGIWDFFKTITPDHPVKVVLFTSYGSPNGGYAGLFEDYTPTSVVHFAKHQLISMKHDSDTNNDVPYLFPGREIRRVGLLLDEQETFDVLRRYASSKAHPGLNEEVVRSIHEISNGHVGVVMGFADALWASPVSTYEVPSYRTMIDNHCRDYPSTSNLIMHWTSTCSVPTYGTNPRAYTISYRTVNSSEDYRMRSNFRTQIQPRY
jgi:hypothetical protein